MLIIFSIVERKDFGFYCFFFGFSDNYGCELAIQISLRWFLNFLDVDNEQVSRMLFVKSFVEKLQCFSFRVKIGYFREYFNQVMFCCGEIEVQRNYLFMEVFFCIRFLSGQIYSFLICRKNVRFGIIEIIFSFILNYNWLFDSCQYF